MLLYIIIVVLIIILIILYKKLISHSSVSCSFLNINQRRKKILNLILYSETNPQYIKMYKILSNYLKTLNIHHYFYCYNENLVNDYKIVDDIIYIKGNESLVPGCLDKTLKVFSICKDMDFDYVVRSNISEVINFDLLQKYLQSHCVKYGGATLLQLQWLDPPSGIINFKYWNTYFIRGNAIIFDREIFDMIESNKDEILGYNIIDDVAFGVFLKDKINTIHYTNEKTNVNNIYKDTIFYRNKSYFRNTDVINMKTITKLLLEEK
jgi:hypothetical protein